MTFWAPYQLTSGDDTRFYGAKGKHNRYDGLEYIYASCLFRLPEIPCGPLKNVTECTIRFGSPGHVDGVPEPTLVQVLFNCRAQTYEIKLPDNYYVSDATCIGMEISNLFPSTIYLMFEDGNVFRTKLMELAGIVCEFEKVFVPK